MSQTALDLFDVHSDSPSPALIQSKNDTESSPHIQHCLKQNNNTSNPPLEAIIDTTHDSKPLTETVPNESNHTQSPTSLLPKATALIRSISDKLPHQINHLQSLTLKPSNSIPINTAPNCQSPHILDTPVSSNASSPIPPMNNKNLALTLDKFSKEDLFKLFGKARKENRVMRQELETLKAKNRDIYRALSASNEQNEVLQVTNQHLREEYDALKTKSWDINNELEEGLVCVKRENEETIGLIKTQCASYMNEVNRLNEQINDLKKENDTLQGKIGAQYTQLTVQINKAETQLCDKVKEKEVHDNEKNEMKHEIAMYREQMGKYKEIARKAEANLDRIESLEEELRDKIRDNHALQIKTRSLNQNIKKITEKADKQKEKIEELQTEQTQRTHELSQLKTDHASYKEHNTLLNDKLNILLKENAENTFRTEKKIESIENYHLSKYKTLLKSFQMMKKRIEANNRMNELDNTDRNSRRYNNVGYSNEGWKRDHEDHQMHFNFEDKKAKHLTYSIDLEMDQDAFMDNVNDLNRNINVLSSHSGSEDSVNYIRYQNQIKEYKQIIYSLQNKLKQSQDTIEIERHSNKKNKRLNKPKNINIDYLRNVLVKFLILTEYLTDEQIVLVPVIGSILKLSPTEKDMIDNSYNNNRYFMGTNTLFPETANAKYSPQKRKKRKKKKDRDGKKEHSTENTNTLNGNP